MFLLSGDLNTQPRDFVESNRCIVRCQNSRQTNSFIFHRRVNSFYENTMKHKRTASKSKAEHKKVQRIHNVMSKTAQVLSSVFVTALNYARPEFRLESGPEPAGGCLRLRIAGTADSYITHAEIFALQPPIKRRLQYSLFAIIFNISLCTSNAKVSDHIFI